MDSSVRQDPRADTIPAHILELDGFRALAIYLVLNLHFGVYIKYLPGYSIVTQAGWVGVPLFFVLSGMLLSLPFVAAGLEGRPCSSIPSFYQRRALRIVPLFYVSMVVFLLVHVGQGNQAASPGEIVRHLFFLHNYQREFSAINTPYWSLAVEVQFYALMPLVAVVAYRLAWQRRLGAALALLGGLSAISLLYRVLVAAHPAWIDRFGYKPLVYASTLSNFDSFAAGMIGAVLYARSFVVKKPILAKKWAYAAVVASLVGVYLLMRYDVRSAYKERGATWFAPALFYTSLNACWVACIAGTMSLPRSIWARFLRSRPLVFVSTISYSLYIWHLLCADMARAFWSSQGLAREPYVVVKLVTETVLVLALSTFTYYAIERPFLRLKLRQPSSLRPSYVRSS